MLPPARPRLSSAELGKLLARHGHRDAIDLPFLVVGIRGYYRETMGNPKANDRCIYDDAILLVTSNVFAAFNGNTDPNGYRAGSGTGTNKGMATLKPGLWPVYRFDMHNGQYMALCQRAGPVTVVRDGDPPYEDTGMFGINIHRGGLRTTSSLGCQTIPPTQWEAFYGLAEAEAKRLFGASWKKTTIPYCLVEA